MATESGCTECGNKTGCDDRKGGMFAAIDEALARLYPTRRWGERDDEAAFRSGVGCAEAGRLARTVADRLKTMALYRPGFADEWSDYIYVLCFGRPPTTLEIRDGLAEAVELPDPGQPIEELYLRVALSQLARFAAVQEVAVSMRQEAGELVVSEAPRTGVFDPVLLPRFQAVVAALAELDIRNIDFGDITNPPDGFDDGDYTKRYGARPTIANYLFFPQPAGAVTTTAVGRMLADGARRAI